MKLLIAPSMLKICSGLNKKVKPLSTYFMKASGGYEVNVQTSGGFPVML